MKHISMIGIPGLFGLGTIGLVMDAQSVGAFLAAVGALAGAILWLTRILWAVSSFRQKIMDELDQQTERLKAISQRLEVLGDAVHNNLKSITAMKATCEERVQHCNSTFARLFQGNVVFEQKRKDK